jgi:hypothetical protein
MATDRRTYTHLLVLLLFLGVLGASFAVPWYHYGYSYGTKVPPPGFPTPDPNSTKPNEYRDYYPFSTKTTLNATDVIDAKSEVDTLGNFLVGAIILGGIILIMELGWPIREWSRSYQASGSIVAAFTLLFTVLWTWFRLPPTMANQHVTSFFWRQRFTDGYGFTTPHVGWFMALAAFVLIIIYGALKYGAQDVDSTDITAYADREVSAFDRGHSATPMKPKKDS